MPYIPNTDADRSEMLKLLGLKRIDDIFDVIPGHVRLDGDLKLPEGLPESELIEYFDFLGAANQIFPAHRILAGGGVYAHFIPPVVKELVHRSEMYSSYTPYQPEVSQGMLQAIFEYQSFVCMLTGMEASNASSYDGGTALMDAVLMAGNITSKPRILLPRFLNPQYREIVETSNLGMQLKLETIPADSNGILDSVALDGELASGEVAALVLQVPNYLGFYEDGICELVDMAHKAEALVIMAVYPFVVGVMRTPGELGADIVVAEGQPLGLPSAYGGPHLGCLATKMEHIRQLPGRIVGRTGAAFDREGFVMTLQAREQHIRRERASSNICTNQALAALQATVYLSIVGKDGFHKIARKCEENAHYAAKQLEAVEGLHLAYPERAFFNEFAVVFDDPEKLNPVRRMLLARDWLPGVPLEESFPELAGGMLLAFTELQNRDTIDEFVGDLKEALNG